MSSLSLSPVLARQDNFNRLRAFDTDRLRNLRVIAPLLVQGDDFLHVRANSFCHLRRHWASPAPLFDAVRHVLRAGHVLKVFYRIVRPIAVEVVHIKCAIAAKCCDDQPVHLFVRSLVGSIQPDSQVPLVERRLKNHAAKTFSPRLRQEVRVSDDSINRTDAPQVGGVVVTLPAGDALPNLSHGNSSGIRVGG